MSKNIRKRRHCPHCNDYVSNSTYYIHKDLYFKNGVGWRVVDNVTGTLLRENQEQESEEHTIGQSNNYGNGNIYSDDETVENSITDENSGCEEFPEEENDFIDLLNGNNEISTSDENVTDSEEMQSQNSRNYDEEEVEIWDDIEGVLIEEDVEVGNVILSPTPSQQIISVVLQALFLIQANLFLSDNCVLNILGLFKLFLCLIKNIAVNESLNELTDDFPVTLYSARKYVGVDRDSFIKYVVCSSCHCLYKKTDAILKLNNGQVKSNTCSNVLFPNHTFKTRRKPCGNILMKSVRKLNGKNINLFPIKTYTIRKIKDSLEELLSRPGFKELLLCNTKENIDMYCDITDGLVWKEMLDNEEKLFFSEKRNIGVMLNLDWFNPFENSEYSLGVIYLTLLNLPREHRFKWENTVLVGIIPGPKEPSLHINTYLSPIVDELLEFWYGKLLKERGMVNKALYKIALLGISNDLPATRKFGGFISFNAKRGCSKCKQEFPSLQCGKMNFSGYSFNDWINRDGATHKTEALKTLEAKTPSRRLELEVMYGARYSDLHRLPYFDPVQMHTVDPMHNLFLGTAKHVFMKWIEKGVLTPEKLAKLDEKMAKIKLPSDVGRIPGKISECYRRMKADEWKNWTLIYSSYCLKNLVPQRHHLMWLLFVSACKLITKRSIKHNEVLQAHTIFKMFGEKFQETFGSEHCSPNMHMHMHLRDCIFNYGPVYSFWCFAWERFNGILGSYHINNHSIGAQFMRKYLSGSFARNSSYLNETHYQFLNCVKAVESSIDIDHMLLKLRSKQLITGNDLEFDSCEKILSVAKDFVALTKIDYENLYSLFSKLYNNSDILRISNYVTEVKKVNLGNEILTSNEYRQGFSYGKFVLAKYLGKDIELDSQIIRPAVIDKIYNVQVIFSSRKVNFLIAKVKWYRSHPKKYFYGLNSPTLIWNTTFENTSVTDFLPLKLIAGRFVEVKEKIRFSIFEADEIIKVIPLPSKSY